MVVRADLRLRCQLVRHAAQRVACRCPSSGDAEGALASGTAMVTVREPTGRIIRLHARLMLLAVLKHQQQQQLATNDRDYCCWWDTACVHLAFE